MSTQDYADIKISFSQITMQETALREVKKNLMYLLGRYDGIMKSVAFQSIKQGAVHNNITEYLQKTRSLSASVESIYENIEKQIEQWKQEFEEADEEFYEE